MPLTQKDFATWTVDFADNILTQRDDCLARIDKHASEVAATKTASDAATKKLQDEHAAAIKQLQAELSDNATAKLAEKDAAIADLKTQLATAQSDLKAANEAKAAAETERDATAKTLADTLDKYDAQVQADKKAAMVKELEAKIAEGKAAEEAKKKLDPVDPLVMSKGKK